MTAEVRALPPGSLARLALPGGRLYGLVHVNPLAEALYERVLAPGLVRYNAWRDRRRARAVA